MCEVRGRVGRLVGVPSAHENEVHGGDTITDALAGVILTDFPHPSHLY